MAYHFQVMQHGAPRSGRRRSTESVSLQAESMQDSGSFTDGLLRRAVQGKLERIASPNLPKIKFFLRLRVILGFGFVIFILMRATSSLIRDQQAKPFSCNSMSCGFYTFPLLFSLLCLYFISAAGGIAAVYVLLKMHRTPRWRRRRHVLTIFLTMMLILNYIYYWFSVVEDFDIGLAVPTFALQVLHAIIMCVQTSYFSGFTLPDLCLDWERLLSDVCDMTAIESGVLSVYFFASSCILIYETETQSAAFILGVVAMFGFSCRVWVAYLNFHARSLDAKKTKLNEEISRLFVRLFNQEEFKVALQQVLQLPELREQVHSMQRRFGSVPSTPTHTLHPYQGGELGSTNV